MAEETSPTCEFAWITDGAFDFELLSLALESVKQEPTARSMLSLTLHGRSPSKGMLACLKYSMLVYSSALRRVMDREAMRIGGRALDLALLPKPERERFEGRRAQFSVVVDAFADPRAGVSVFRKQMGLEPRVTETPRIRIAFDSVDALCAAYNRQVSEGALFIPALRPPEAGRSIVLQLAPAGAPVLEAQAQVLELKTQEGVAGFRARLIPSEALRELVSRQALKRREERRVVTPTGSRKHARYQTSLEVEFKDAPELSAEYATNISKGGLFVRTSSPPPLRAHVQLRLRLPGGEVVETEAEVVHTVSGEESRARNLPAGAGLSFATRSAEFHARIESLLSRVLERKPLVLIADEDGAFLERLAQALRLKGMDVETADSGEEALRKLVDRLLELDLLVLDLKRPQMDSAHVLYRVRHLGGEMDLPVMLLSHEPETVASFVGGGGANEVLSKATPFEQVVARAQSLLRVRETKGE